MKTLIITEAQFVSLFGNKATEEKPFYQDGDFVISNDKINKARENFYPYYDERYNRDKAKILHQLAFQRTMRMIDNGVELPEFGDRKIYNSFTGLWFSKKQVEYVEKDIINKYGNLSVEELYDQFLIDSERGDYEIKKYGKDCIIKLLDNGTFDKKYPRLKELAMWTVGRNVDVTEMLSDLFSINNFDSKRNIDSLYNFMRKSCDDIANNDDRFTINPIFCAFNQMMRSISILKKKQ